MTKNVIKFAIKGSKEAYGSDKLTPGIENPWKGKNIAIEFKNWNTNFTFVFWANIFLKYGIFDINKQDKFQTF